MNKYFVICICFFLHVQLFPQRGLTPLPGAKSAAIGGCGTTLRGIDAVVNNQAGMVTVQDFAIQLSSEQKFFIRDLNAISFSLIKKIDQLSAFGLLITNLGLEEFKEQKFGLSYARNLHENLAIGAQFDYILTTIKGYGSKGIFSFELGMITMISRQLRLGIHIFNPMELKISEESRLDSELRFGLEYLTSEKISLFAELSKVVNFKEQLHFGFAYRIHNTLIFRVGTNTEPSSFSFGLSYRFTNTFVMDGGFRQHQHLGYTPSISLNYERH